MQTPRVNLTLRNVKDESVRQELKTVDEYLNSNRHPFLGFVGVRLQFAADSALTSEQFVHGLTFVPDSAWVSFTSDNTVTITIDYMAMTRDKVTISTSGAVNFDIIIGKFT